MQRFCAVSPCGARAHHKVLSTKLTGVEILACTYHVSGVSVALRRRYGGIITVAFLMAFFKPRDVTVSLEGTTGRHELAG